MAKTAPMSVDALPFKYSIIAFSVAWGIVLISFIVGLCGPSAEMSTSAFAYKCPNNTHTWAPNCTGVQPGLGEKISVSTPHLTTANRFWALNIRPYNKNLKTHAGLSSHSEMVLDVVVNVSHRSHMHSNWTRDIVNKKHSAKVVCPTHVKDGSEKPCDLLSLVFEEYVDAEYHLIEAFITSRPGSKADDPAIGDVELIMNYGTKKYMDFEVGVTVFYLLASLAAFVLFIVSVRKYNFRTWSYQQMWTFAILIAVILYNNPLFVFKYVVAGWFLPFLDAVFKELFLSILLIFWLHSVEEFRDGELFEPNDKKHGFKVIAAAVYFVLAVITYTWSDIADRRDPVLASPFEIPGVVVFYVFTVIALTGMIAWLVVLTVLAVPKIAHSPLMFTRFLYLSIPSLTVAIVVAIGAYCGNYGTGNKNSFQLMLYSTLYNVYTWLLVFGFWPVSGRYEIGNPKIVEEGEESHPIMASEEEPAAAAAPAAGQPPKSEADPLATLS